MSDEKRMMGDYEITHSVFIGDHEIVMGENLENKDGYYYMIADARRMDLYISYENCLVSDDFTELAEQFAIRLSEQVNKLREDHKKLPTMDFIKLGDCTGLKPGDNIKNKIIVIKPEVLRSEHRFATEQLYYATGGFGTTGYSRGSSVRCINLYSGDHTRFERSDVMGTMEPDKLPEWAVKNFESIKEIAKNNKDKER